MSTLDPQTLNDLHRDKEYAHEYMDEFLNTSIATQIKALREQNKWTQEQLAEAAGMHQEQVTVLENVNHSSWTINTLRKLARAFDLTLHVSFENFSTELRCLDALTFENIVGNKSLERIPREANIGALLKEHPVPEDTADLSDLVTTAQAESTVGESKTAKVETPSGVLFIVQPSHYGMEYRQTVPTRTGQRVKYA